MIPYIKLKLSNGLTVLYLHTKNDPISACHLFIPTGSAHEKSQRKGISNLLNSLYLKGTKKRSAKKLAEDIESLGAYLGGGATHDYNTFSFYSISDNFKETLDLSAEILFDSAFLSEELSKEKAAQEASIQSKKESIFTITHEEMNRHLYKDHPYSSPSSGDEKTVHSIKADHIHKWHKKVMLPNQAIMSIASNIPFKDFLPFLEKRFGPDVWESDEMIWKKRVPYPTVPTEDQRNTLETNFEQAFLMLGFPAAAAVSDDYVPLKVINAILGGGMSTRLFQSLREKQGLAYDVGSFYPSKRNGSAFYLYLGLQESKMKQAEDSIRKELDLLKNEKVSDEELNQIKSYLKGTFILDHQTNSQRAHYLGWWQTLGLTSDFDQKYPGEIDAVTADVIQKTAQKYFDQKHITIETVRKKAQTAQVSK